MQPSAVDDIIFCMYIEMQSISLLSTQMESLWHSFSRRRRPFQLWEFSICSQLGQGTASLISNQPFRQNYKNSQPFKNIRNIES